MDKLATELLEEIFSQIDSPRDLLNLAIAYGRPSLTSQIIPRHTEYRDLRADMTTPEVWAHLARRPDLTKNIRSIHGAHSPILGTTHGGQPFTLMDEHDCNARKQRREETIKNMTLALRSMTHLKIFLCAFPANPSILRELSRMATLEQLNGFILSPGRPPTNIQHVVLDWNLPKLKDLQVKSFRNTDIPNLPMSQLLRQSGVSLQRLTISELCLNDVALDVHLPSLSYLKITHDGHLVNPPPNLVQNIVTFLARHSSINDLTWNRKYGQIAFPRHVLPNLKMLRASTKVLRALDRSHDPSLDEASENPAGHTLVLSKLDIEYLHAPISIAELNALCCLNRECLKRFCVDTEEPFAEVKRMGELFPSIQCLSFSCPPTFKLAEAHRFFGQFKNLEQLVGRWPRQLPDGVHTKAMLDTVFQLVSVCPKLRQMPTYVESHQTNGELTQAYIMREPIGDELRQSSPRNDPHGMVEMDRQRVWYEIRGSTRTFYDSRDGLS